jgi:hypothetical protein
LYAVGADNKVKLVSTKAGSPAVSPVAGSLGRGGYDVDAVAASVTNTDLALTTNKRSILRRAAIGGEPKTLLTGVTDLLRPQFTRYGEVWAIGRQGGTQRMWMATPDKSSAIEIDAAGVVNNKVTAFKISPDGTRMALVRSTEIGGSELGLARIVRSQKKIIVEQWRPLDTTQKNQLQIGRIADVAWIDATELLVLGSADAGSALAPFRVVEDASRITPEGDPENWNAVELTVLPRTQTAVIVGSKGTWKDNGSQWLPFVDNVKTIAFPG